MHQRFPNTILIRKGTEEVPYQRVLVEGAGSQSGKLCAEVPESRAT